MKDIKTKKSRKDIKIYDKKGALSQRMKNAYVRTKSEVEPAQPEESGTPADYATEQVGRATETVSRKTTQKVKKQSRKIASKGKEILREKKAKANAGQDAPRSAKDERSYAKSKTRQQAEKRTVGRFSGHTSRAGSRSGKGTVKQAVKQRTRTVKTAKRTADRAVKTSKIAAKTAARTAKTTARAAAQTAKATAKALVTTIKGIIAGTKALVAMLMAGGWIALLAVIIICMIAMLVGSVFGIFFGGDAPTKNGMTIQTVVADINTEYTNRIEQIKANISYDELEISGAINWPDTLAVYAVRANTGQEIATMDNTKKALLRAIFWDMYMVSSKTEPRAETVTTVRDDGHGNQVEETYTVTKTYLCITVTQKSAAELTQQYGFTDQQNAQLAELQKPDYADLWSQLIPTLYTYSSSSSSKE